MNALALLGFLARNRSSHGALMRRGLAIFQRRNGVEAQFDSAAIEWKAASSATQGSHVPPAAVVDFLDGLTPCARFSDAQKQHETKGQAEVRENRLHGEKVIELQKLALTGKILAPSSHRITTGVHGQLCDRMHLVFFNTFSSHNCQIHSQHHDHLEIPFHYRGLLLACFFHIHVGSKHRGYEQI